MALEKYTKGKGIDVSPKKVFPQSVHEHIEGGNLYLLRNKVGVEEFDYLYCKDTINLTKYYRIFLYEWFLVVKPGGYLIFDFRENNVLDYSILLRELSSMLIYRDSHQLIHTQRIGRYLRVIIKKTRSVKIDESRIDQWTFGIITNGKRLNFLKKSLESIKSLGVPEYEIIVCGKFPLSTEGLKYINFTDKDEKGWITKKKNIICQNAKYDNICIIHDRIYFDKEWFEGVKKYGNYFEVMSFPVCDTQKVKTKYPYSNWGTIGKRWDYNKLVYGFELSGGQLSPQDWDRYCYVGGAAIALKKPIWKLAKWNEDLFWREYEDIELSHRQHQNGIMIRFNFFAKLYTMTVSQLTIFGVPYYKRNKKRLGRYSVNPIIILLVKSLELFGLRKDSALLLFIKNKLSKIKKIKTSVDNT